MNYLLPAAGVLPMHCAASYGRDDQDVAVLFGLSGTGKTTLSADPERTLVGDDEHGWSDRGVFNFEGGCYAKVINLSPGMEPEIHRTTGMFGTILENVGMDIEGRQIDLNDATLTENTRASYPLSSIPRVAPRGAVGHPKHIVMLTADAFGVLPPISSMTTDQAMYHFLSGYTAKVAGTERGIVEPQATFSTCFGGPFMALDPSVYAKLLGEKVAMHHVKVWLVNTGWTGGPYGTGHRMEIGHTKSMLRAALSGKLDGVEMKVDPVFGLRVPASCPDVPLRGPGPEVDVDGSRGVRPDGAEAGRDVPRELRPVRRSGDARGPGRGVPQNGLTRACPSRGGGNHFLNSTAISPTMPRRNASTQRTKIDPVITITHSPIFAP